MPKSATEFPPPTWLVDWASDKNGKQGAIKWCVLEELGRMLAASRSGRKLFNTPGAELAGAQPKFGGNVR